MNYLKEAAVSNVAGDASSIMWRNRAMSWRAPRDQNSNEHSKLSSCLQQTFWACWLLFWLLLQRAAWEFWPHIEFPDVYSSFQTSCWACSARVATYCLCHVTRSTQTSLNARVKFYRALHNCSQNIQRDWKSTVILTPHFFPAWFEISGSYLVC